MNEEYRLVSRNLSLNCTAEFLIFKKTFLSEFIERRKNIFQTFAVIVWVASFTLLNSIGTLVFFWILFFSSAYRWIAILYLLWVAYDWKTPERGGRKWKHA